jgi:hypothetical protein
MQLAGPVALEWLLSGRASLMNGRALSRSARRSLSAIEFPSLSVIVAWTPTVGIGCPIWLAAPRPVGAIERRARIAVWTTSRAASPPAFFHYTIMPCCALTRETGVGS